MIVYIENQQASLPIDPNSIVPLVEEVLAFESCICDEVGIHLVEKSKICALHAEFFNDPSSTDCISFPIDGKSSKLEYRMLGDVFVCPAVAIEYAEEHQEEVYRELSLYIIHGLLHLMGYDDIEEKDRAAMRKAEERHLAHLGKLGRLLKDEG